MSQENMRIANVEEATRLAQGRESTRTAEAYLTAIRTRNIEALGNTLHPDLHVVGPTGEVHNRSSFLETMEKTLAHLEAVDVTAHLASGNQTFYLYNLVFAAPTPPLRTGSLITHHEDGQIKKIEIIAGPAHVHYDLKNQK